MQAPIESHKNVHGKNGITDLKADPSNAALYYTAGKDGRVGMWRLDEDQSTLDLLSITNTSLGWIARLCWMERHLVYLAFTSVTAVFRQNHFEFKASFSKRTASSFGRANSRGV